MKVIEDDDVWEDINENIHPKGQSELQDTDEEDPTSRLEKDFEKISMVPKGQREVEEEDEEYNNLKALTWQR